MSTLYNTNIREHSEGFEVSILEENGDLLVTASNQGGYDKTAVNVKDLLEWVLCYKPEYIINAEKSVNKSLLSDAVQWMATHRAHEFYKIVRENINAR